MIDGLLEPGAIRPAYQPIVDLATGDVVAYEALARFDPATGVERPDQAFDAVADSPELTARLDHACMRAAITGALEARLPKEIALFVNVLPATLSHDLPPDLVAVLEQARGTLSVVAEVTEIGVTARPAELLAFTARCRDLGFGVAVDDVGVNPDSLALLPLLRPDVIKLDRSLLSVAPTVESGRVLAAVLAAQEATGAVVLAEGIETEGDVHLAVGLGAAYGQGWHHGFPAPLQTGWPLPVPPMPILDERRRPVPHTPFDLIDEGSLQGRSAPYTYLLALSLDLEDKASRLGGAIVASTFQEADRFTPATAVRYERLAGTASLVGAMAEGLAAAPAPGVRGADLGPGDPLRHDWNVVVLAPHFAGALIARDRTSSGPVRHRRYDYGITHEPRVVALAARSLLGRVLPH